MHAGKLIGLLGRELIDAVGGGDIKGIERLGRTTRGRKRLAHTRVKRTRVIARTGKVDSRAIGLHGVRRSAKFDEAAAELAKGGRGGWIGAIDGGLAEGSACIGEIARLEQRVAKTQIGLKRRGVGRSCVAAENAWAAVT